MRNFAKLLTTLKFYREKFLKRTYWCTLETPYIIMVFSAVPSLLPHSKYALNQFIFNIYSVIFISDF